MATWVTLTKLDGSPISVNMDQASRFEGHNGKKDNFTRVLFSDGEVKVTQSVAAIQNLLK